MDTFATVWFQNSGDRTFTVHKLPPQTQLAPVKSILTDLDDDRNRNFLVAVNIYHTDPNIPRADAWKELWLRGDGHGGMHHISPYRSGFLARVVSENSICTVHPTVLV